MACALLAGMPTRRPALAAASSTADSHRFEPLRATTAMGLSRPGVPSAPSLLILSVAHFGK